MIRALAMTSTPASLPEPAAPPTSIGKVVLAAAALAAIGAFFYFDLSHLVSFDSLKVNRDRLLTYAEAHVVVAALLFVASYAVVTGLSLPGAAIMTLAGGFLFGAVLGTVLANIGATTGATASFLGARYLFREWVERRFGATLAPLQQGFARNAFHYLLTLRLIPLFPFFLVNLVAGLTRMSVGTFVFATAVGIIPGGFVYAYAGRQLGSIDSLRDVASPGVVTALTLLGLLALVPVLYQRWSAPTANSAPAQPR